MSTFLHQYRKLSYDSDASIFSEIISRTASLESSENQLEPVNREKIAFIKTIEEGLIFREYPCYQTHYLRRDNELYDLALEPDKTYTKFMFKFDYRSSTMEDASLFQNDIQMEGFPKISVFHPEIISYSVKLDGIGDYVDIPHSTQLNFENGYTVSFWLYPAQFTAASQQIFKRLGSPATVTLSFDDDYDLNLSQTNDSSTTVNTNTDWIKNNGVDKWYHIVIHYDKSTLKLYIDNIERASIAASGDITSTGNINLGASSLGLAGFIDELLIYKRPLDLYEIEALYNMDLELNIQIEGCVLWHGFNGGNQDLNTELQSINTNLPFIKDNCGFHTAEMLNGAFFDSNVPPKLVGSYKWRDFMYDVLSGHKLSGNISYRITEKNNDLRLTNKATSALSIWLVFVLKSFDQMNGRYQTLFSKVDDPNGNYSYRAFVGLDQKLYFFAKWNGVEKGVRTKKKFPKNQLLNCVFAIDGEKLSDPLVIDYSQALKISVNGFYIQVEPPTIAGGLPSSINKTTDLDFLMCRSWETLRGYIKDDAMIFYANAYNKLLTTAEVLALATNYRTISDINLGHVAELDIMLLQDDSDPKFTRGDEIFIMPKNFEKVTTVWNRDAVPTARAVDIFDWDNSNNPEGDTKETVVTTWNPIGAPPSGGFSVFFDDDDEQHIDTDVIEPIRDKFSISVWIKFLGLKFGADFGCIVSQLDKMKGGNRLMVNDNTIRWHGQFKNDNNKWNDERVTVPSLTGAWHHIVLTHDGDKKDEFKLYLDAQLVYEAEIDGHVQQGEGRRKEDESHIGKGESGQDDEDAYFYHGYIDKLLVKKTAITQQEILSLYAKNPPDPKNMLCYYEFEKTFKDSSDNDIDGKGKHGVEFSTDVP